MFLIRSRTVIESDMKVCQHWMSLRPLLQKYFLNTFLLSIFCFCFFFCYKSTVSLSSKTWKLKKNSQRTIKVAPGSINSNNKSNNILFPLKRMAPRILLFIFIIKKILIHLANCLMTCAVAIFCLPDMPNDTVSSILTSRCRSILHRNLFLSSNWILGQLITGPRTRNLMRKSGQKSYWATCTWVQTTRGR